MPGPQPSPWPAKTICVRMLRSKSIKQKQWWDDLSRAVGGRLRPFALAVVPTSECGPEVGLVALIGSTLLGLVATTFTVQLLI